MSFFGSTDYSVEVGRGRKPGVSPAAFVGTNPALGKTLETLWDPGGLVVFPTNGEQWQARSLDPGDTGPLTMIGLDDQYDLQIETKNLNGTSAVVFDRPDWFRPRNFAYTNLSRNLGGIIIEPVGGGDIRSLIRAGKGQSFNGFYTVEGGKSLMLLRAGLDSPKNKDIIVENTITDGLTGVTITGGDFASYQSFNQSPFESKIVFCEKTDLIINGRSTNKEVLASFIFQGYLFDETLPASSFQLMGLA